MAESEATSAQGMDNEASASVTEGEVQQLDARAELIGPVAYRHNWGARNGWWRLNLTWGGMTASNQVYVSIHEGNFIGSARYSVYNVAPYNGGVEIRVYIDWGSPINVFADYYVV